MRRHTRKSAPPQKNKALQEKVLATMLAREVAAKAQWEETHSAPVPVVNLNTLKELESADSEHKE